MGSSWLGGLAGADSIIHLKLQRLAGMKSAKHPSRYSFRPRKEIIGLAGIATFAMTVMFSCSSKNSRDSKSSDYQVSRTVESEETNTVVSIDGGAYKGASADFPPGALSIGTVITAGDISAPNDFLKSNLKVTSTALVFSAEKNKESIPGPTLPMTLKLPLPAEGAAGAGQGLTETMTPCILGKTQSGSKFIFSGDQVTVDSATGLASVSSKFFGTYTVTYCGSVIIYGD